MSVHLLVFAFFFCFFLAFFCIVFFFRSMFCPPPPGRVRWPFGFARRHASHCGRRGLLRRGQAAAHAGGVCGVLRCAGGGAGPAAPAGGSQREGGGGWRQVGMACSSGAILRWAPGVTWAPAVGTVLWLDLLSPDAVCVPAVPAAFPDGGCTSFAAFATKQTPPPARPPKIQTLMVGTKGVTQNANQCPLFSWHSLYCTRSAPEFSFLRVCICSPPPNNFQRP